MHHLYKVHRNFFTPRDPTKDMQCPKLLTPNSRHNGQDDEIMEKRKGVYESARKLNPQRFNKGIRKWEVPKAVALNPTDEIKDTLKNNII